jgi:imidazolonepropionase
MQNGNLIIKNAAEVVTCRGSALKKGASMNDLGIITDGAIVIENGIITAVGITSDIVSRHQRNQYQIIDAAGQCVMPGFVDSHTHLVFGGYRAEEFSWRLRGDTYMQIMERRGGIVNTVRATRQTAKEELKALARTRLDSMLTMGVTTVEAKSGYGLDLDTEIKQLEVMKELADCHPLEIVSTFMGAHAIPAEYKGRSSEFIRYMIDQVLPVVAKRGLAEFCDVFCEQGVFSLAESRELLQAARKLGLQPKIHADEIVQLGGAELAAELGAISADHLLHASDRGITALAEAGVVATLLPATAFSLREPYARGREMIDRGAAVALATDLNPGSCFTESIPLVLALAVLEMRLTPAEAITALTINGAAAVGRAHSIGSIEAGKQADIILLEHPSHLFLPYHLGVSSVREVIKKGNIVWRKH